MDDVEILGMKLNPAVLALAAGGGVLLLVMSNKGTDPSSGVIGTDQGAADYNGVEELRSQVQGGLNELANLIAELRGKSPVQPVTPTPSTPTTPSTPAIPRVLSSSEIAVAGTDYDPNGQGALIADIGGPVQLPNGKWIVTENWYPVTTPTPKPFVPMTGAVPAVKPNTQVLEGLPVINATKPSGSTVVKVAANIGKV